MAERCHAKTKSGSRCTRWATEGDLCSQHAAVAACSRCGAVTMDTCGCHAAFQPSCSAASAADSVGSCGMGGCSIGGDTSPAAAARRSSGGGRSGSGDRGASASRPLWQDDDESDDEGATCSATSKAAKDEWDVRSSEFLLKADRGTYKADIPTYAAMAVMKLPTSSITVRDMERELLKKGAYVPQVYAIMRAPHNLAAVAVWLPADTTGISVEGAAADIDALMATMLVADEYAAEVVTEWVLPPTKPKEAKKLLEKMLRIEAKRQKKPECRRKPLGDVMGHQGVYTAYNAALLKVKRRAAELGATKAQREVGLDKFKEMMGSAASPSDGARLEAARVAAETALDIAVPRAEEADVRKVLEKDASKWGGDASATASLNGMAPDETATWRQVSFNPFVADGPVAVKHMGRQHPVPSAVLDDAPAFPWAMEKGGKKKHHKKHRHHSDDDDDDAPSSPYRGTCGGKAGGSKSKSKGYVNLVLDGPRDLEWPVAVPADASVGQAIAAIRATLAPAVEQIAAVRRKDAAALTSGAEFQGFARKRSGEDNEPLRILVTF